MREKYCSLAEKVRLINQAKRTSLDGGGADNYFIACSVGWFVSLLVCEEVLLAGLYEREILFRLEIYDRLRQATTKRTACKK